jgi:hypothetical protein
MRDIAQSLGGAYHHVDRLGAATVVDAIHSIVSDKENP